MSNTPSALGTKLRRLLELLDGDVDRAYVEGGLAYRARYTPVTRRLLDEGPASIRTLSRAAGLSHSAASQTIAQMVRDGLLTVEPGRDARERIVSLSDKARAMLPDVQDRWSATSRAAASLDAELGAPLETTIDQALAALDRRSFRARMDEGG